MFVPSEAYSGGSGWERKPEKKPGALAGALILTIFGIWIICEVVKSTNDAVRKAAKT